MNSQLPEHAGNPVIDNLPTCRAILSNSPFQRHFVCQRIITLLFLARNNRQKRTVLMLPLSELIGIRTKWMIYRFL